MIEMSPAYSERCRTYIVAGKKREKDYKKPTKNYKSTAQRRCQAAAGYLW
jgi:hypothetical protein